MRLPIPPSVAETDRWESRPWAARVVRAAIFAIPLLVGFLAGAAIAQLLPDPTAVADVVMWWIIVVATSSATATIVDRWARRFLPLSWLMQMTMLFPDKAPSRFSVARRSGNVTELKRRIAAASEGGDVGLGEVSAAILSLATELSNHDRRTRGHSERTRAYTDIIAEEMGIERADRDKLRWAALLHDVGKLEIPADILNKDGKLDDEEWRQMRRHPIAGMQLIDPLLPWLGAWAKTIEHHHERWDGTGYPYGLAGTEIALGARIVAVADAFDVMTAGRAYQAAMSPADAREEIAAMANKQFDPAVVRALMNVSLGRLRWVAGPMAGVLQIPLLRGLPAFGRDAATLVTSGALMTTTLAAGLVAGLPTAPPAGWFAGGDVAAAAAADASLSPPDTASGPFSDSTGIDPAPNPATRSDEGTTIGLGPRPGPGGVDQTVVAAGEADEADDPDTTSGPESPPTTQPGDPLVMPDTAATDEDAPVTIPVLANDSAQGGVLVPGTLRIVGTASIGSATTIGTSVRYVPQPDTSGSDLFSYEVCDTGARCATGTVSIVVAPVNDAPVAAMAPVTVAEDQPVDIAVAASDIEGDAFTCRLSNGPDAGTATVDPSCSTVSYAPMPDFNGADALSIIVDDGIDSTIAAVQISVTPVNDAPVARPDTATTAWSRAVTIPAIANDSDVDGDVLTPRIIGPPAAGSVTVTATGVSYVPEIGRAGTFEIAYEACDQAGACSPSTIRVEVTGVMVALDDLFTASRGGRIVFDPLGNDLPGSGSIDRDNWTITAGPAHGDVRIRGARIQYSVDRGFTGTDSLTYQVCDTGGTCDTATVTIVIE